MTSIHTHTCQARVGKPNPPRLFMTYEHQIPVSLWILFFFPNRTKWKRQATVGIELLTEAGNIAAMQSLCARLPWMQHPPPPSTLTPPPLSSSLAASLGTNMDLYYRHAAALLRPPFVSSTPSTWIGSLRNEESNEAEENSDKLLENDKS